MDLSTTYLGIELPHPVMPSASQPLTRDLDSVKRLEDGGAAAVVLHSLFEEQIRTEAQNLEHFLEHGTEAYAEALSYFPAQETYVLGPDEQPIDKHTQELSAQVTNARKSACLDPKASAAAVGGRLVPQACQKAGAQPDHDRCTGRAVGHYQCDAQPK